MISGDERRLLNAGLREDLATFIQRSFQTVTPAQPYHHNWHIEAIACHLEQCAAGNIQRLVITLPPRSLKSICASVAFPAWVLGHHPSERLVCASYSGDLAAKHARDSRSVMESDWYKDAFPNTRISDDKNAEMDFTTTKHGYRYSTSVGGTLTGRGGNFLIIDDPLKPDEATSDIKRSAVTEWFDSTLYSRLDDKRHGVIIVIMQRLHVDDLVGHILEQEPWVHLNLPAIAEEEETIQIAKNQFHTRSVGDLLHPDREPKDVLDRMKAVLGSFKFSAQYQQNPLPLEGSIIKWSWFRSYDSLPQREPGDIIVQSWDTASKPGESNDYSVCTTWFVKGNLYYLTHVYRERLNYPDLKNKVIIHAIKHQADTVLIEDKSSGTALIQELQRGGEPGAPIPIAFKPEGDKVTRMCAQSAKIEAGHVHLPRSAPWLDELRMEVLQFPRGRHDDQVDSLSQFLAWVQEKSGSVLFSADFGYEGPKVGDFLPKSVRAHVIEPKLFIRQGGRLVRVP